MGEEFRKQLEEKAKQLITRKTSSHILPEVIVTSSKKQKGLYPVKHKFKGFDKWVSPKRAGNMTVMPGDSEMVFFAPIAAGAAVAASPAISGALGSAVSGINTAGDALAATAAGQRLTSGLNFAANAIGKSKAWPWIDAGLSSLFAAHGADKIRRGDIHNVGDVVETGLDLMPLTQLTRPMANIADKVAANVELYNITRKPVIPEGYTTGTEVGYNYGRVISREPRTSLSFYERRPSKITEAERMGIPKGERNLTISKRDYPVGTAQRYIRRGEIAKMDDNARYASEMFKKGDFEKIHSDETIRIPDRFSPTGYQLHLKTKRNYYFSETDPYADSRLKGNMKNIYYKYNDRDGDVLGKDLPQEFYDYLEQIKDTEIHPNFTNLKSKDVIYPYKKTTLFGDSKIEELKANEIQSKYVRDFRQYLGHLGYDISNISDHQILQLLTDQYKALTKSMSGKTKGQVFWHGSPKYNEVFDFSHTGENTGNMGALGPGNYFSSGASAYGNVSQPYLITGIKETPIASQSMIDKGLIPEYVSPSQYGINARGGSRYYEYLHDSPEEKLKYPQELRELYENALSKAKEHIKTTPIESSRLWIDPALIEHSGVAPQLSLTKIQPMEFMLRRNTGIKSLFPHPSIFTKDANGRIIINRNWEDPRVNYKNGGTLGTLSNKKSKK